MRALFRECAAILVLLSGSLVSSAHSEETVSFAENVRADLAVNAEQATLSIRLLKPTTEAISSVAFAVNDRRIASQWSPFPAPGQTSRIVALLDVGGLDRAAQIHDSKSMMLLLGAVRKEHQHYSFGTYASDAALLVPASKSAQELLAMVAMVAPLPEPSNLSATLLSTIISFGPANGDRRAVFVFTDGHNDSAVSFDRVAEAARAADVAISFILSSSNRTVNVPALARLANDTGGSLVGKDETEEFLRNPLQTIETGGIARASMEQSRKYFWDRDSHIRASVTYGSRTLDFAVPATLRDASIVETAQYIASDSKARVIAAAAVAAVGLTAFLVVFLLKRRKKVSYEQRSRPYRSGPPVLGGGVDLRGHPPTPIAAILESEAGDAYPVQSSITHIGRSTDNQIIISDPAVSRLHAIMRQQPSGQHSIENRSDNGTFVNDTPIEVTQLVEGDLIKIGSVTLRYIPV